MASSATRRLTHAMCVPAVRFREWKMRNLVGRLTAGAVSLLTAVIVLAPAAAVSAPFDLYVGYADGLRASGFFPNPWAGSPGVQFFLGQSISSDDAGAIMIINTSGSNLSIN